MRFVYADNSATTPMTEHVIESMLPYMKEHFGNPSSLYAIGQTAHRAITKARAQVAAALGADEREIFFTSGGSEADNWAIFGTAQRLGHIAAHAAETEYGHMAAAQLFQRVTAQNHFCS